MEKTAAAAILYQAEPDDPWSRIQSEKTREQILKEICKVDPEEPVFAHIMGYIREMERNISGTGEPDRTAHENLLREVRKNV